MKIKEMMELRAQEKAFAQIDKLHDYLDRGVITQEEYEKSRARVLTAFSGKDTKTKSTMELTTETSVPKQEPNADDKRAYSIGEKMLIVIFSIAWFTAIIVTALYVSGNL